MVHAWVAQKLLECNEIKSFVVNRGAMAEKCTQPQWLCSHKRPTISNESSTDWFGKVECSYLVVLENKHSGVQKKICGFFGFSYSATTPQHELKRELG